jgi:drug/metabolite transporter (DMT)-like permease
LKTKICLLIIILANALGNVVLRYGMQQVGNIASYSPWALILSSLKAMSNPFVLVGVGLLIIFFIAHMIVLSWADLSYVLPMTSLGYIMVTVLGWLWLGEKVSFVRWVGIAVITVGVMMVGQTPSGTTQD